MLRSYRRFLRDCATVALATAGATGLRYLFNPTLGIRTPLLFHVLAIAIAAQVSGTTAGFAVTCLSVVLIDYLFVPPFHTLAPPPNRGDQLALLLFLLVGISLSFLCGRRKRVEDELAQIRYNLETAQQIANIGSWASDLTGKLWWSRETYKIFGVAPGAAMNIAGFYELVHPEDRDRVRQAVRTAVDGGTDYEIEHRIVRRSDAQVRYVHQKAKVVHTEAARLIGSVQDITESRRGEMAQQILGDLLQVCSACRRIRDQESDQWYSMEAYLRQHSNAKFSHGMCTDCSRQWFS